MHRRWIFGDGAIVADVVLDVVADVVLDVLVW